MKALVPLVLLAVVVSACAASSTVKVDKPVSTNLVNKAEPEEEYVIRIIDPYFNLWFSRYARPVGYYQPSYYERWNNLYADQWNHKVTQYGGRYPFEFSMNYDPRTSYGLAVNYKLFWYFQYVEARFGKRFNFGFGSKRNMW